jgi:hypothetical protein
MGDEADLGALRASARSLRAPVSWLVTNVGVVARGRSGKS